MYQILIDALSDSLRTVPLLLLIYIGIELLEYKFGDKIREWIGKAGKSGLMVGAIGGAFPQCGFSVVATALFSERLITMGTLLAVYLSTSDEAIPIMMSRSESAHLVWPIIGIKILVAVVAGLGVDLIFKKEQRKTIDHIEAIKDVFPTACCGHSTSCTSKKFNIKEIFWHPVVHTINVFGFIFITTLILNYLLSIFELKVFDNVLITALIGLIPNCVASVTITELYLKNTIGFGPAIAGLSASGGLGLLILWREEKNKKIFFKVLGLLYVIAVIAGLVV